MSDPPMLSGTRECLTLDLDIHPNPSPPPPIRHVVGVGQQPQQVGGERVLPEVGIDVADLGPNRWRQRAAQPK